MIGSVKERMEMPEKFPNTEMHNIGRDKDFGRDTSTLIEESGNRDGVPVRGVTNSSREKQSNSAVYTLVIEIN